MMYPFKFKPVYKDYIWGGENLKKYNKSFSGSVAESWEVSCHPDGESVIENGKFRGLTLSRIIKERPEEVMGNSIPEKYMEKFPLLIKLIDANDKLSVQVHPDDEYAKFMGSDDYGKNEMWHILEAKPGAKLVYGLKEGVDRDIFIKNVEKGTVEDCLDYIEVYPGDTIYIPAGVVHAIGEGIILAEVQQNSNLTFRVYDYNRTGKDGKPRELHVDRAIEVIDFKNSKKIGKIKEEFFSINDGAKKSELINNEYFIIEKYYVEGKIPDKADGSKFIIYVVLDGECEINYKGGSEKLIKGNSVFIPAAMGDFEISGDFKALRIHV
ncbi:MAG TPA: mannose-6-phosphate isomerase [Ruminiclostridium sp.]|jgi:mannose-6-phosphate isomerase|uniref:Phosphohexomutase n=1 Tax=Acetivibrio saccincola TaxID=1677857 RepID=A0A2K9ENB9_9FIRM|nr:type I phosphomannose isomerase catalytic subunit [Acetivibrio saccincola]HAA43448.1 mannose-6-phosphate isomerase [Ruminiclostridium sp.]AUG56970.1 putative mannose-6-phosphate isomerase GmuF [Acetivibrio saccincola]NLW27053.1 class I mannose-6-phosphate isomerase [Acetivibrio saccincola]PQQ66991.1 hypothetical protein B9R14_09745 [Acetivibrio saccincola]HOA98048.1 class I mannose-6-phosphate isomerase [Acetivibrio saccincola]